MALETKGSTCEHPEGSTPILTVSIPGGLAINLLGILAETCPICITVYSACPDPLFLPVEDKATDALGNKSSGSPPLGEKIVTSVATGTSGTTCSFNVKLIPGKHGNSDSGEPKPLKLLKSSKHPKPLKPPKHSKPPKHPRPPKHPKPPRKR